MIQRHRHRHNKCRSPQLSKDKAKAGPWGMGKSAFATTARVLTNTKGSRREEPNPEKKNLTPPVDKQKRMVDAALAVPQSSFEILLVYFKGGVGERQGAPRQFPDGGALRDPRWGSSPLWGNDGNAPLFSPGTIVSWGAGCRPLSPPTPKTPPKSPFLPQTEGPPPGTFTRAMPCKVAKTWPQCTSHLFPHPFATR